MIKSVIKLSKKSLAILIALLMIISVMPFTPPISVEAADNSYATSLGLTSSSASNKSPEAFTDSCNYNGEIATGGYSNVVYSTSSGIVWGTQTKSCCYAKHRSIMPTNVVNVYDGENEVSAPIAYEIAPTNSWGKYIHSVAISSSDYFQFTQDWQGYATDANYDKWPANHISSTDDFSKDYGDSNKSANAKGNKRYYWNKLVYKGSFPNSANVTDYYQLVTSTSMKFKGSYDAVVNYGDHINLNADGAKNYIINYRPIYDVISGKESQTFKKPESTGVVETQITFKDLYKYVWENPDRFTAASRSAYFDAVNGIINLNVHSYFSNISDSEVADKVTQAASAIKNAYEAYNTAVTNLVPQFSVKFVNASGTTVKDTTYYPVNTLGSQVSAVSTTSKKDPDSTYHYSYSWPSVQNVTKDVTYKEVETKTEHSYTNKYTSGDTATVECSICKHTYTLSYEAYNAELTILQDKLADTDRYTPSSIVAATKAMNDVIANVNQPLTQAEVKVLVDDLIIAENSLVVNKFTLTFNVATVDGKTLAPNITGTGTYEYGTMVELDLPEKYQTNYVVTTWKRNAKGVDKVVGGTSTKLYVVVNQESTYTAVINSVATDNVGDNAVLTLNNKSGKTIDVGFVETNKEQNVTVDINNSTITIGSVELTAPTYSFYTLKGFYIDKTPYSESGGTVTITKDTVITPYYEATKRVNIKRASGESFTINNENIDSYPANWNQKVTLKSSKEVMWLDENDVVLAQGTTYSFYANVPVTIKTKAVTTVDPTASIGYFDYDSVLNKVTVVNNFFVPSGKTAEKAGVILSTKNSTVDALKVQSNGKFEGGPESFTSTGNQIRISVSRTAITSFNMYALAYVVVDGQTYWANEVVTYNYTAPNA